MDIIERKNGGPEKQQIERIREGDRNAFEDLFFEYFYDLCSYAFQITKSEHKAKDIVQEVFYKLWKRRKEWIIHSSLKAYLFQSVRNEALNQVNHEQYRRDTREELSVLKEVRSADYDQPLNKDDQKLLKQIWNIVVELPQRRRSVFVLHRKHGLSYKEIAEILDISRKTVENHMGLALDDIRKEIERKHS